MTTKIHNRTQTIFYIILTDDGKFIVEGVTPMGNITETKRNNIIISLNEKEHINNLKEYGNFFTKLPASGTHLDSGERYNFKNKVVIIRKSHVRTNRSPANSPTFFIYPDGKSNYLQWTPDEHIMYAGLIRELNGKLFISIMPHISNSNNKPAEDSTELWKLYVSGGDESLENVDPFID